MAQAPDFHPIFASLIARRALAKQGISLLLGATASKRIKKATSPTAEHIPKSTVPFIDAIVEEAPAPSVERAQSTETNGAQLLESQVGTRHGASARPVSARMSGKSELSEPSKKAAKLSYRLSHPGLTARKQLPSPPKS